MICCRAKTLLGPLEGLGHMINRFIDSYKGTAARGLNYILFSQVPISDEGLSIIESYKEDGFLNFFLSRSQKGL